MISGIHAIIYSKKPEQLRAFFRDVLKLRSVDAGDGWLIFALPPAELGIHPIDKGKGGHELFLMCSDINRTLRQLRSRGVKTVSRISDRGWGLLATLRLPGGVKIGLYQPKHRTAIRMRPNKALAARKKV